MKKTIFKQVFLLFLLAGIIYACLEDDFFSSRTSVPPEVSAAQKWFNSQVPNGWVPWTSAHDENELNAYKPDWKTAFSNEDDEFRTVEVHLVGEEMMFFVLPDCARKYEETEDPVYMDLSMDTRLVIRTNKETKETDAFIMIISADVDYVERNREIPFPVRKLTYLNRDPEFSGLISYHNIEGGFINAWTFKNREINPIYPDNEQDLELRSDWYICDEYCWIKRHCFPVYSNGDYMYTDCLEIKEDCWYDNCRPENNGQGWENPGSVGNTGSGSNTGSNNSPKQPQKRPLCPASATNNSNAANTILNSTSAAGAAQVKPLVDQMRILAKNSSNEHSMVINKSGNQYAAHPQGAGYIREGTSNNVSWTFLPSTYMIVHTHTGSVNAAPSVSDVVELVNTYKGKPNSQGGITRAENIEAFVILAANGSEYMIYVDNREALKNFCNNSTNSDFFENNTSSGFKAGSKFDTEYQRARNNMEQGGYSKNDAQSYALTRVLDHFGTGLKISKKAPGATAFKEQETSPPNGATLRYTPTICP